MDADSTLLDRYAREGAQDAFASLVARHVDFVFSVALRRTGGDAALAHDVSQQVFLALARRASTLARHPVLLGWLHTCTCQRASDLVRAEARRRSRETVAATDPALATEPATPWETLVPEIDDALATLGEADRQAILLRYFAGHAYADIGQTLGLAENTARMRTERALEKLRRALARRSITSTASALGLALGTNAITAAPASVAASTLAALGTMAPFPTTSALGLLFMNSKLKVGLATLLLLPAAGGVAWWLLSRTEEPSPQSPSAFARSAPTVLPPAPRADTPPTPSPAAPPTRPAPSPLLTAEEQALILKLGSLTNRDYMAYLEALLQTNPDYEGIIAAVEAKLGIKLTLAEVAPASLNAKTLFVHSLGHLSLQHPRALVAWLAGAGDEQRRDFAFLLPGTLNGTRAITAQNAAAWLPDGPGAEDILNLLRIRDAIDAPRSAEQFLSGANAPAERLGRIHTMASLWPSTGLEDALSWAGEILGPRERESFLAGLAGNVAGRDPDLAITLLKQLPGDPAYAPSLRAALQPLLRKKTPAELTPLIEASTGPERAAVVSTFAETWAQRHDQVDLLTWLGTRDETDLATALGASAVWLTQENRRILLETLTSPPPSSAIESALIMAAQSPSAMGKSSSPGAYQLIDWLATRPGAAPLSPEGTDNQKLLWQSMEKMIQNSLTAEWGSPEKVTAWINRLPFATPEDRDRMLRHIDEVRRHQR
jgi:RNA polymerase sigma factor (sigma-70 family)